MVPEVEVIKWNGFCPTHDRVLNEAIQKTHAKHPGIPILVHPECRPDVFADADMVGSTSQILAHVRNSDQQTFVIGTEMGILHALKNDNPDKTFYMLSDQLICSDMKKTTLKDVLSALQDEKYEIFIDDDVSKKAYQALERMLNL
jgi:quinolinate synthase